MIDNPALTLVAVLLFWGVVTGSVGFAFGYEAAKRKQARDG